MEIPSKEILLEELRLSEEEIKAKPNVFFDGLRKILLGYAVLYDAITIHGLPLEIAAKVLAVELDLTEKEATTFTEMFISIDWSDKKEKPQQHGGAEENFIIRNLKKIPGFEDFMLEAADIWKDVHIMPPQRYVGSGQHLIHWEDTTDHVIGAGFGTINFLDRVNDALSRRVGVWAVDRFRPYISPTQPIPTQLAFSFVILLIELVRMLLTLLPDFLFNWISPFFSTIMAVLEIARGDWKHAILTLYGSVKSGFWSSMRWKMVLNTLTLISPETKAQIMEIALNTPRDIMRAFIWWLVTFVMPRQEEIAKVRDLLYVISGTPISGIGHLEVQDFYKIRNLFSDSPIFCLTPVQIAIRKITEGDPWYIYLLPEDYIKKIQAALIWPYRKAANILIDTVVTIPVLAEPAVLDAKCGKPVITKMYEILRRVIDNKEKVQLALPDSIKPKWKKLIEGLEYVDAPDRLLDDAGLSMLEAFGPMLELKEPNGIRRYFQEDFLKQLEGFVGRNDKAGFKQWIHKFPKDQILDLNQSVKLLDPAILPETGRFAAQMSPVLQKVSKKALKLNVPEVDSLIAALSHMENPNTILDKHGVTPSVIIEPIINDPKIRAILEDDFVKKLRDIAATGDKIRFVDFLSNYPKGKMFKLGSPQSFLSLTAPKPSPQVSSALRNFSVPLAKSPSLLLSQRLRRRTRRQQQPRSQRSVQARVRTRKTRR
jgi:hypothetical protein